MLLLDITVVNTALPDIQEDLDASFTDLQWVIDAYTLTLAAFTLSAGSLADRLGRRRVFAWGLAIFTVASLACALAPSATALNVARAVQGVGGAVMFALSLALIAQEFRGRELGTATGIYGATIGGAVAIGPLVGGALTDGLGWPSIFYLNVPIGIAAVYLTMTQVRESRDPDARGVDWVGTFTFSGALLLLVLALLRGNEEGWGSTTIVALLAGAALLLVAFVVSQLRVREPMLPLALFRIPSFTGVQLGSFAIAGSQFALFLYITLYLQNILGYSPLQAGFVFLVFSAILAVVDSFAGRLAASVGTRAPMAVGMALCAAAFLLLSLLRPTSGLSIVIAALLVAGVGQALAYTVSTTGGMQAIPEAKAGAASGILSMIRLLGAVFGVAVTGALFKAMENSRLAELLAASGAKLSASDRAEIRGLLSGSGAAKDKLARLAPSVAEQVDRVVREAFVYAFDGAMLLCMAISLVGALTALLVAGKTPQHAAGPAPESPGRRSGHP